MNRHLLITSLFTLLLKSLTSAVNPHYVLIKNTAETPWQNGSVTLYTTKWKNNALSEPPLKQWLTQSNLDPELFIIKTFDQELFGIQEAITGSGLVFCSTTLVQRLLNTELLKNFITHAVESEFCYYVPNKQRFSTRDTRLVLKWVEGLLSR